MFETKVDGKPVRSPDHPCDRPCRARPAPVKFEVRRSKGFEGMAASPDGKFLYPLLEGPLWDGRRQRLETKDGKAYLRILEFDVAKGEYTGKSWKYALEAPANAIGDFNMIDATERPDHRARRQRGRSGAGLQRTGAQARLLQRAGQVQAHLQGRLRPRPTPTAS